MANNDNKVKKTTMKRYTLPTLLLIIVVAISCNKLLEVSPETDISDTNFWKSPNDFKLAANFFYAFLPQISTSNGMFGDNQSDDGFSTSSNNISDGSRQAPANDGANWDNNYFLIRACNNLLEKSVAVSGNEVLMDRYRGEARFFRALAYYNLVIRFGEVPLLLHTFDEGDSLINARKTNREVVIDSIYADLDWAAAKLQKPSEQLAADYGRITNTAALALKAKMALFEGTRQKFHNYGKPSKHLSIAKEAAATIMASGEHSLFKAKKATLPDSSYYYNFQYDGEGKTNKENILVRIYGADITNKISTHVLVRNLEQGAITPTRSLVDAYCYQDGLPYTKSIYDSTSPSKQVNSLSQFSNRDNRMAQTIFTKKSFFITNNYTLTYIFSPTGYKTMKYFIAADWGPNVSFIDYQVIRYAEVLLTYAEATFELNGVISDVELDKSINLTRARAGLPRLTNVLAEVNALDMREEIRRERRVELAMEGHRYWDLIRWKTAEIELAKEVKGTKHFAAEYGNLPGNTKLDSDGFVIVQSAANRKFDPAKDYLWPLPINQMALQPNLQPQNPGW